MKPDPATVERLRRALAASAGEVELSGESWHRLQAAIAVDVEARPRRPVRRWLPALAAAAAVVAVGGVATAVRLHQGSQLAMSPATMTTYQPTPPAVEPLPVYYAAHLGDRWALVREFHPTTLTEPQARLQAAVDLAISGHALDPDETSVWRHLGLSGQASATYSGQQIRITLPSTLVTTGGPSPTPATLGSLAIEQLVWTATAVTQQSVPVLLVAAGGESRLLQAPLGNGTFSRSSLPTRLAPVWVNSLNEGDPLRPGTATIRCEAVATDEGAPTWTLLHQDGGSWRTVGTGTAPLSDEFGQPTALGRRGGCVVHLPLATTGRYRLEVRDDEWVQTRGFVVR